MSAGVYYNRGVLIGALIVEGVRAGDPELRAAAHRRQGAQRL